MMIVDKPSQLVDRVREHYVAQFRAFVADQCKIAGGGVSELKIKINAQTSLFGDLYCLDFYYGAPGGTGGVELLPDFLCFEAFHRKVGEVELSFLHLRWDDVIVRHDLKETPQELASWFNWWFDPDDQRADRPADVSGCIHSLLVEPGYIDVDFGTADADALWTLLEVLDVAGAKRIEISSSRAEAESSAQ